ncbi:MAG: hypothetical protein QOG29_374, partial [Gaiellaceae bacterium]|nr:hypothetical protein [Gaiellaceae bacterium]
PWIVASGVLRSWQARETSRAKPVSCCSIGPRFPERYFTGIWYFEAQSFTVAQSRLFRKASM